MNALDRVRQKFGNLHNGPDRTDKRPSDGSVSSSPHEMRNLSELPPDLVRRLKMMGHRWRFSPSDLEEVVQLARESPEKWLRAVVLDERREAAFRKLRLIDS